MQPPNQPRQGTFLLICMALMTAMGAVAYAYILAMRVATDTGPALTAYHLVHQTAKAGATHAAELLMRDYLDRPRVPTSEVGPHRIFFDPIDNFSGVNPPRDALASGIATDNSISPTLWNDNDLLTAAKLVNPYRAWRAHNGRQYDFAFDNAWQGSLTSPTAPRYIESMFWSTNFLRETGVAPGKIDVTVVPGTNPEINTPIYYDARWQPVANRAQARYRLRYAVMCEDLSGHFLGGLPAAFTRGDPLAVDGDLIASGLNDRGTEADTGWALKYSPSVCNMLPIAAGTNHRGNISNGPGSLVFNLSWLGLGGNSGASVNSASTLQNGFTTGGVLTISPWAWQNSWQYVGMAKSGVPLYPPVPTGTYGYCRTSPHRAYTWQGQRSYTGSPASSDNPLITAGLITPYGAPTTWDAQPNPESSDAVLATLPYNAGPTDCPWRINPLTAPAQALSMLFCGFRSPPSWEHALNYKFVIPFDKYVGTPATQPTWLWPANNTTWQTRMVAVVPAVSSRMGFPNPFRSTFTSRRRGTTTVVRPFAQFVISPSADNPRSRTDPHYPSAITDISDSRSGLVGRKGDQLGRFSALYGGYESYFASSTARYVGTGWSHPDGQVRSTMIGVFSSFPRDSDGSDDRHGSDAAYTVPTAPAVGDPIEIYVGSNPFYTDSSGVLQKTAYDRIPTTLMYANSIWLDALAAASASANIAAAAYQQGVSYPIAPPSGGDSALFAGRWGNATLDTDTDGDGFKDAAAAIANVADMDRLFLCILGEDPDHPGNNLGTREALYPVMKGSNTLVYNGTPYRPILNVLRTYDPATTDYGTAMETNPWGAQNPYVTNDNSKLINLRRSSLLNIRRNLYLNDTAHPADSTFFTSEASDKVRTAPAYPDARVVQKAKQLMRCRLRDAERLINDMRMSFFGANLRYRDRTRAAHASLGRFRPYDLDGDGWAICSAYCPSDVAALAVVTDAKDGSYTDYRFSEPADWSKVVLDDQPDNPGRIDATTLIGAVSTPVWVCFKDVDTAAVNLTGNSTTCDFTDFMTYTADDGAFPAGPARNGYTRWFYPAVRVLAATDAVDGAVTDGVAAYPPDTYFSMSGYFTLEKSHFYRLISRGEVWDEMKKSIVDFAILESAFMLDPDGNMLTTGAGKAAVFDPATGRVVDAAGLEDSGMIYQRWLKDLYGGTKDRSGFAR